MASKMKTSDGEEDSDFVVSAPGKVIIHGEHAVVHGKSAIAASVDLRCYLRLRVVPSCTAVSLNVPDLGISSSWSVDELRDLAAVCGSSSGSEQSEACEGQLDTLSPRGTDGDAVKVLAAKTFLLLTASIFYHGRKRSSGLDVTVASSLPFASGLGSSASYSVCIAAACLLACGDVQTTQCQTNPGVGADAKLLQLLGLSYDQKWRASSLAKIDLEAVRSWSFQGERLIHGTPSGIDNAVATFGGALEFCRSATGDQIQTIDKPPLLRILLTNTSVPRSTKVLVAGVRSWLEDMPDVAGPVMDAVHGVSKQCCLCWQQLHGASADERRVVFSRLERLVDVNQSLLKCMGVSHPSIEKVCQITADCGLQSKLTGAGGGGCVMTLYSPDDTSVEQLDGVKAKLAAAGFTVFDTVLGGAGVTWHHRSQ